MTQLPTHTRDALEDVSSILNKLDHATDNPRDLRFESIILFTLLVISTILAIAEWTQDRVITNYVLQLAHNPEEQSRGVALLFVELSIIGLGLYYLAWRRGAETDSSLRRVLNRNLKDLALVRLLPDLLLKYFLVAILIFSSRPDLLATLFVAFTADYVLQRRFFRLPAGSNLVSGLALYGIAIFLFVSGGSGLSIPLLLFSLVTIGSIANLEVKIARGGAARG